ncbi:hypothetical protein [Amycolatopsis pigmentata]|uniref:Uncharacterized protein n=1 Tax=Amycolatopsis pigmentata TaxID=450801 RepID=A0ABW5G002_9PSEU
MGFAGRLAAVVVVAGAAALWYFTGSGVSAGTAPADDAAKVYCLSADQRARLSDAATALGISPAAASTGQGPDFTRACDALTAAARIPQQQAVPSSPAKTALTALIPLVAGAALTWVTGFWRDERTQSRLLADALREASRNFRKTVRAEQRKWFGPPSGRRPVDVEMLAARDELAGQLRKIAILRAGWRMPGRLKDRLMDEPLLGEEMNTFAPGDTPEARAEKQERALKGLSAGIDDVVGALEQPWRWHRAMRGTTRPSEAKVSTQ